VGEVSAKYGRQNSCNSFVVLQCSLCPFYLQIGRRHAVVLRPYFSPMSSLSSNSWKRNLAQQGGIGLGGSWEVVRGGGGAVNCKPQPLARWPYARAAHKQALQTYNPGAPIGHFP
jgi:hypothetical protein